MLFCGGLQVKDAQLGKFSNDLSLMATNPAPDGLKVCRSGLEVGSS